MIAMTRARTARAQGYNSINSPSTRRKGYILSYEVIAREGAAHIRESCSHIGQL
jgi:hypothetical protein